MKSVIVLIVTVALLAAQYHFGLRRRKLRGAVLPAVMAALFAVLSWMEKTAQYIPTGLACVLALAAVWAVGYFRAARYEKEELEKMKAKDLE